MSENQQNNQNSSQTNQYNNGQSYNQEYYRQQGEQIRQLVGEVGKIAGTFAGDIVKTVSYSIGTSMNEVATQLQKDFEESKNNTRVQEEIRRAKQQARYAKEQARYEIRKARDQVKSTMNNVKDGYGYSYDYQYGTATPHPRRFKNRVTQSEALQGGLMAGFGGFFSFCFFIAAMALMLGGNWLPAIILFTVMGLFGGFSDAGKTKLNRNKRYLKYMQYMQGRGMCEIEELALFMNKSEAYVRKDLTKMIKMGYFQTAYMDRKRTCIFLDKAAYDAYINGFEMQNPNVEIKEEQKEPQADPNTEFVQMLQEGRQFIADMGKIRSGIVNEDISKKILKLEQTSTKILQYIEEHPEKATEIRKFMRYYLPTTIKLLNTYKEMESQNISGEIIENTMKEIDGVLTTIDSAFTTLLDNMFQQDAMDIAAEINVMNNMMTQEGLAGNDFAKPKTKKAKANKDDEPKLTLDTGLDTTIAALDANGIGGEDDDEIQLKL